MELPYVSEVVDINKMNVEFYAGCFLIDSCDVCDCDCDCSMGG